MGKYHIQKMKWAERKPNFNVFSQWYKFKYKIYNHSEKLEGWKNTEHLKN